MAKIPALEVSKNSSPNIEYLWNIYISISEWVRFSDTKAGAILVVNGTIAAVAFTSAEQLLELQAKEPLFNGFLAAAIVGLIGSTAFALRCLLPTIHLPTSEKIQCKKHQSMIFFLHIANEFQSAEAYSDAVRSNLVTPEQQAHHLSEQIWANSRVACGKFENVKYAIWFLAVTTFITVVGAIVAIL